MPNKIHHLDSLTIDKIAAGEVIDVPASCVKELVENSLDAGATDILVEVVLGGRELIRVSDDGCGMGRDDVAASIERHATSKLSDIDDLESLTSRGFRGEALASIVAISRCTVTSSEGGQEPLSPATVLKTEGGRVVSIGEATRSRGTTMEVSSLFFNVPARRKFLKSPAKDTADIIKIVTCLALTAPQASFRLIVDGRLLFFVQGGSRLPSRIRELLKEPFAKEGIELEHVQEGIRVEGLIVDPKSLRSNRSGQYLMVNGRSVSSLPISYAVKTAYGTACDERRHPLFALHVSLDPASIDVNVHPQKREIRFADEEWVRIVIQEAVSRALFGDGAVHSWRPSVSDSIAAPAPSFDWNLPEAKEVSFLDSLPAAPRSPLCFVVVEDVALIQPNTDLPCGIPGTALMALDLRRALRTAVWKELLLEKASQALLVPVPIEASAHDASLLQESLPVFEAIGMTIRAFGPTSFLVESLPALFTDLDVVQFVRTAIHDGVLASHASAEESRRAQLALLYVAASRALRPPISSEMALSIFSRWVRCGAPMISLDGQPCCSRLTSKMLKESIREGKINAAAT